MRTQSSCDVAFSESVKAEQEKQGSRNAYQHLEERGGWPTKVTAELEKFIAEVRSAYLGTANKDGQPYIQHRGGPKGFIKVLDEKTLGFVDYVGNKQYISTGNIKENSKAFLFLMDYSTRRRIKIWGRARVVQNSDRFIAKLMPDPFQARPQHIIVFRISAWDQNCKQHIPRLLDAEEAELAFAQFQKRISELEVEIKSLRAC